MRYTTTIGDETFAVEIEDPNASLSLDGAPLTVDLAPVTPPSLYSLLINGHSYEVFAEEGKKGEYSIVIGGEMYPVRVQSEREARLTQAERKSERPSGEVLVKAPMPGVVVAVEVAVGDAVQPRQGLVILEAMKMENEIRAPQAGTVRAVQVVKGQKVEQGQTLVVIG